MLKATCLYDSGRRYPHKVWSGLTSLKAGGRCLPLTAINEALEAAAQIADRSHAPEIANQIRALKWEAKMPSYASEIQTARDVA